MIDGAYRKSYESVFREVLARAPEGYYDEVALPSYTHANPFMSWLFWRRVDVALSMAGDLRGASVLDFGCGGGVTFRYLSGQNCRISGCDSHSYQLAEEVCRRFGIAAEIYRDITDIKDRSFDYILALDVLEHVDALDVYIDRFLDLSHQGSEVIISGPTENLLYKLGRRLAGFSGHYHVRNIYDIERRFMGKPLTCRAARSLYFPAPLFRVSAWRRQ